MKKSEIQVRETIVRAVQVNGVDYICITDIAKQKNHDEPNVVVANWLRNRNTIEYLGMWESLYNENFKPLEFEGFRQGAGLNAFTLAPSKWVNATNAVGLIVKAGNNGGTFAQRDIAFKFASWVSVEFELYLIKEFQRLKEEEQNALGWSVRRELTKINYRIHTDAVKNNLVPVELTPQQIAFVYASEADVLNVALFGTTAKQWRDTHPKEKGNIRDYASVCELICLANMESINAVLINDGIVLQERLVKLNRIAIQQMSILCHMESDQKYLMGSV